MDGPCVDLLGALTRGGELGRVMIVVAHPDDETLGAGASLADRADAWLVHLTDGAPRDPWFAHRAGCESREAYAALRALELDQALRVLGLGSARRLSLGVCDQEACACLVPLSRSLARIVAEASPALVITHAYEGGHPDHDAAAFATRAAISLLPPGAPRPMLAELAGYHAGAEGRVEGGFLARPTDAWARTRVLTPEELQRRDLALASFGSQDEVITRIARGIERFRPAGSEDFGAPAHAGTLHYEEHRWPIDGVLFRANAERAARELGLRRVLP